MTAPSPLADGVLTFAIEAGGKPIASDLAILRIDVWTAVDSIPTARIVVQGEPLPEAPFPADRLESLLPGATLEIRAGYGGTTAPIFAGVVVSHGIEIRGDGSARIVLKASGHAVAMTAARRTVAFTAVTDAVLMERLIVANGLTPQVASTAAIRDVVIQDEATDWELLLQRARMNGMHVIADASTVTVTAADLAGSAVLRVAYGESVRDFEAEADARAHDSATARGRVSFDGSALARPGDSIEIEGIGGRFDGPVLVSAVHHALEDGGWTTTTAFGLPPASRATASSAAAGSVAGASAPIRGLERGIVDQVAGDPAGSFRVRVRLPRLGDTPLWAPLSSFYASKAAGAVFYPDVGDEVVVGFVDGELSAPIVLGSVYDATRPPAVSPESGNGTRAIVTRSKLELRFDEEHRIVTLRTPGGHEVTLDDTSGEVRIADATLNKVTLGTGGIRIDSASDLTITAARHVVVSAGGDLRLKATQDVACEGNRVDVEAQTAFSARGNATADLIAAGVVTVRGVVVKIN